MAIFGCNFNAFMPMCSFAPIGYPRPMMPPMPMPMAMPSIFGGFCSPVLPAPLPIAPLPIAPMPMFAPRFNYPEFAFDLGVYNGINNTIVNGVTTFNPFLTMPQFQCCIPPVSAQYSNNNFLSVTSSSRTSSGSKTKKTSSAEKVDANNYSISGKSDLSAVNKAGYNFEKGKKLVDDALNHAESESTGWCATYVKRAIQRVGLGEYIKGDAYECADILSRNPNFKEVKVYGGDLRRLPAGCIIVYDRGVAGYDRDAGHIEITTGTGCAVSDFVNCNIKTPNHGVRVFVPV